MVALVVVAIYLAGKLAYTFIAIYFPTLVGYVLGISDLTEVIIGAYAVYRLLLSYSKRKGDVSLFEVSMLILRILLYAAVLVIAMSAFGINPQSVLAGSAIGGIIIGLRIT